MKLEITLVGVLHLVEAAIVVVVLAAAAAVRIRVRIALAAEAGGKALRRIGIASNRLLRATAAAAVVHSRPIRFS